MCLDVVNVVHPREKSRNDTTSSEQRSKDLAPDGCWGDFWLFRLGHRRDAAHEVDVLQLGDLGLVDDLVA